MKIMRFYNLQKKKGYFSCEYEQQQDAGNLIFQLNPEIECKNDLIALALSTLCGRGNYEKMLFDFEISSNIIREIGEFCSSEVEALMCEEISNDNLMKKNIALNFSGGFDSLAAKYLMPEETFLISMDFGGKFKREKDFFMDFPIHMVSTNILETGLHKNSWSFMGIGTILYSEYLNIKHYSFGGILEASKNNFSKSPIAAKNIAFPPFKSLGLVNAPFVIGITEIATAMIIGHFAPDLLGSSLDSLANIGEEKRYRKQLISDIVSNKFDLKFSIDTFDYPKFVGNFGTNFAVDFLVFYFLKYIGLEATLKLVKNIPADVIKMSERLSLNFYERFNPDFIENFPSELLPELLMKLGEVKILPYTSHDWNELKQVTTLLSVFHEI